MLFASRFPTKTHPQSQLAPLAFRRRRRSRRRSRRAFNQRFRFRGGAHPAWSGTAPHGSSPCLASCGGASGLDRRASAHEAIPESLGPPINPTMGAKTPKARSGSRARLADTLLFRVFPNKNPPTIKIIKRFPFLFDCGWGLFGKRDAKSDVHHYTLFTTHFLYTFERKCGAVTENAAQDMPDLTLSG